MLILFLDITQTVRKIEWNDRLSAKFLSRKLILTLQELGSSKLNSTFKVVRREEKFYFDINYHHDANCLVKLIGYAFSSPVCLQVWALKHMWTVY